MDFFLNIWTRRAARAPQHTARFTSGTPPKTSSTAPAGQGNASSEVRILRPSRNPPRRHNPAHTPSPCGASIADLRLNSARKGMKAQIIGLNLLFLDFLGPKTQIFDRNLLKSLIQSRMMSKICSDRPNKSPSRLRGPAN